MRGTPYPDPRFFLAAPVRDQAKRIFWRDLLQLVPGEWRAQEPSLSDLSIRLVNGSEIAVIGMDRPERIEGSPWDGGVVTEFANVKADAWPQHIRPALADRNGWCDLEGVPEGRNHMYDLYRRANARMIEKGAASVWGTHFWSPAGILTAAELEEARQDLDELSFRQEYGAEFVAFEGLAYYAFNDGVHCRRLPYDPNRTITLCLDFNVDPGVAVVVQEMKLPNGVDGTGIIGEVWIERNSNTQAVCNRFIKDWGLHRAMIEVTGDATGGARKSSQLAGTDIELAKATLATRFPVRQLVFKFPTSNPSERARINTTNSRLRSTNGIVRMMVDPVRAPQVVRDFEGTRLLTGGSGEIDKRHDKMRSHLTDALSYHIFQQFPIVKPPLQTINLSTML